MPSGRRKCADMRTIFYLRVENAEIANWVADHAVSRELLSAVKFPDHQGKYREFCRFWFYLKSIEGRKLLGPLDEFDQIPY